jgi:DNA-binding response OmpR family regulator
LSKRILSVSYDEALLRTREILLRRQGYSVTSALGFTDAAQQCGSSEFDLFILGHSIPLNDQRELIRIFQTRCASPVLALRRRDESAPDGAKAHVDPFDIEDLLETVDQLLGA